MKNVSFIKDCYGCGVCAIACPKKIIALELSVGGFYKPVISAGKSCVDCGICLDVCSFIQNEPSKADGKFEIKSYASWSNDADVRNKCSSGGLGYELGVEAIRRGYAVCGVKYDIENERAEHYIATDEEALKWSRGSKYIPSYTVPGFNALNKKDNFLVIGTPCQVDSLRRYIQKFGCEDNYLLMDFYCHGVPSILLWKKYLKDYRPKGERVVEVSWRNKEYGWHDSWVMNIKGESSCWFSRLSHGDLFFKYFLENRCLNKACYHQCKYKKEHSAADIRIGDLWGSKYKEDEQGVSAVLALSSKGEKWLTNLKRVTIESQPLSIIQEEQMHVAPHFRKRRHFLNLFLFRSSLSLSRIHTINCCLNGLEYYKNRIIELFEKR